MFTVISKNTIITIKLIYTVTKNLITTFNKKYLLSL